MDDFERQLANEQEVGRKARLEDAPPVGMLPDGTLNVVQEGSPRQPYKIIRSER